MRRKVEQAKLHGKSVQATHVSCQRHLGSTQPGDNASGNDESQENGDVKRAVYRQHRATELNCDVIADVPTA